MPKTLRGSFEQALRPPPSVVKGVQACRLPGLKRSAAASTRHSGHCPLLLGAVSVSVCLPVSVRLSACLSACLSFCLPACLPVCLSVCPSVSVSVSVNVGQCRSMPPVCLPACSSLPFARPQMPKTLRGSFEQALRPLPSVVKGVQACRLPGLKCLNCPLLLGAVSVSVCLPVSVRLSACLSACLSFCLPACLPVCLSVCPSVSAAASSRHSTLRQLALRPVVKGVQACRLPGLKCLKRCAAASSRHSSHCPLACRLPGLKCLKRCAAASSRHSGHCPLLLRAFTPTVCQASNA